MKKIDIFSYTKIYTELEKNFPNSIKEQLYIISNWIWNLILDKREIEEKNLKKREVIDIFSTVIPIIHYWLSKDYLNYEDLEKCDFFGMFINHLKDSFSKINSFFYDCEINNICIEIKNVLERKMSWFNKHPNFIKDIINLIYDEVRRVNDLWDIDNIFWEFFKYNIINYIMNVKKSDFKV